MTFYPRMSREQLAAWKDERDRTHTALRAAHSRHRDEQSPESYQAFLVAKNDWLRHHQIAFRKEAA